jgi:hypothetical protein
MYCSTIWVVLLFEISFVRIPMMSISHSDLMSISSERSDAEPSQCETVIDISQEFLCVSWFGCKRSISFVG